MHRALWIVIVAAAGCATTPTIAPWPCDRVEDRPEVDAELQEMKATQEAVLWDGHQVTYAAPGEKGLYRATREWVVEADAACAANRALAGQEPSKIEPQPWWRRLFGG